MTEGEVPVADGRARRPSTVLVTRLLGAAAALAAAVLAIVGSFLALVSGELRFQDSVALKMTVTGWELDADPAVDGPVSTVGGAAQNGIPLTVAAAFLIVAALLCLIAAPRVTPAVVRSAAVLTGAVSAAFLAGVVGTVAVQAVNLLNTFRPAGAAAGNARYSTSIGLGAGFWLELAAGVLAVGAVVLTALPSRPPPGYGTGPPDRSPGMPGGSPPPVGESPEP